MSEFVEEDDADKVRAGIVERYHRGPDGPIEPWEDASFIVYQVTDRYGFLHKNPLPKHERDERILEVERERARKWVKMLGNWDSLFIGAKPSEKLRRRIYKGIPDGVRGEAWKKILDIEHISKPGVYDQFRKIAIDSSPDIRQIDLDVNRTYRDHIMFRDRFCVKQQALFNILAAYSMYNTDVGYCQGMSGIAALLLMYMNEEDAFWSLSELLTDRAHAMHGLFIPEFPKLHRFQNHHDKIIKKLLPKVSKHLEKEGVFTSLYSLKWFMQVFLDRLPFSLVLRVYDIYMIDGEKVITAMSYHILKLFKKSILKMDLEKIAPFLQEQIVSYQFNDDDVIETLQESMNELKKTKLDKPPPPSANELPVKPPGTLPDRNSYITASKRARMSKKADSIMEVPMGRPPSPELSKTPSPTQNGAPSTIQFRGITIQQPNAAKIPSPKPKNKTSKPAPPSYAEFVGKKTDDDDDIQTSPINSNRKKSKDKIKTKDARKGSDTKFYIEDGYENNMNGNIDVKQSWSTQIHTSVVTSNHKNKNNDSNSIYDNDSPRTSPVPSYSNGYELYTNGKPATPPRDYFQDNNFSHYKPNKESQQSNGGSSSPYKDSRNMNSQYATETRL